MLLLKMFGAMLFVTINIILEFEKYLIGICLDSREIFQKTSFGKVLHEKFQK